MSGLFSGTPCVSEVKYGSAFQIQTSDVRLVHLWAPWVYICRRGGAAALQAGARWSCFCCSVVWVLTLHVCWSLDLVLS